MTKPRYYIVDLDNHDVYYTADASVAESYMEHEDCLVIDTLTNTILLEDGGDLVINEAILENVDDEDETNEEN